MIQDFYTRVKTLGVGGIHAFASWNLGIATNGLT
jgi:hypothetical protein